MSTLTGLVGSIVSRNAAIGPEPSVRHDGCYSEVPR